MRTIASRRRPEPTRIFVLISVFIGGVVAAFLFSYRTAGAYPINGMVAGSSTASSDGALGNTSAPGGWQGIVTPFEGFIKSVNGIGSLGRLPTYQVPASGPPASSIMPQQGSFIAQWVRNAFQSFDNWLYGILGFHISGLLTAVLNIFSWLLGIVKGAVDWFLGAIH